jgi:hypothetical protein
MYLECMIVWVGREGVASEIPRRFQGVNTVVHVSSSVPSVEHMS